MIKKLKKQKTKFKREKIYVTDPLPHNHSLSVPRCNQDETTEARNKAAFTTTSNAPTPSVEEFSENLVV
jgi:hypothetical protein